jgi:hypothetical protein
MKNLVVVLDQGTSEVSKFSISKLKIKNLNFKKSTAYELALKVDYKIDEVKTFKTSVNLVGELKIKDFLEKGELKASTQVKISSTSITGLDMKIPKIKGDVSLSGKLDNLKAKLNFDVDNILNLSSRVMVTSKQIKVSDINTRIILKAIVSLLEEQLGDSFKSIDVSKTEVFLTGGLIFDLEKSKVVPSLSFESKKPISIGLIKDIPVKTSFSGELNANKLTMKSQNTILSGIAIAQISSGLDLNNLPAAIMEIPKIKIDINVKDIIVSKKMIQSNLYSKSKKKSKKSEVKNAKNIDDSGVEIELPRTSVHISGENIKINNQIISIDSQIELAKKTVKSESTTLVYGRGNVALEFISNLVKTNDIRNTFSTNFNNVRVDAFNAFFPPYLSDLKGEFRGAVKGSLNIQKSLSYKINAKVDGKDGEMKNLNVMKFLRPTLEGIPLLKGKVPKKYNVSDKFEKLSLKVYATETNNKISKLSLIGNNKDSKLEASGNVSMVERSSKIMGTIYVKEVASDLKKGTAQELIPFKLSGEGFGLLPNISYTTDQLATLAAKVATKKAKKDIDRKIKKKSKDLKKKLEDELKKKFKGFKL